MKWLKGIGLFFVVAVLGWGVGFFNGVQYYDKMWQRQENRSIMLGNPAGVSEDRTSSLGDYSDTLENATGLLGQRSEAIEESRESEPFSGFLDVASLSDVLGADTEYVIEEKDVLRGSSVETKGKLPQKYIGMDLERFVKAMETLTASPPLSELERGFVGAQVLNFSRQRVTVQMNYRYVQPGECFYLALVDHRVVVFLEDKKTIYISTGISSNMLSEELREEMMEDMIYIENEQKLFDFLEAYSS